MVNVFKFTTLKVIHFIIWLAWALLLLTYYDERSESCFTSLFGKYISYRVYNWVELAFMFGGGWLLLALFLQFLNKYVAYILFELLFIGIVLMHLRVYLCK